MSKNSTKDTKSKSTKKKRRTPTTEERLAAPSMNNLGEMNIYKGFMNEIKLAVWDAVPQCNTACILHETCPFACTEDSPENPKCEIKTRYLNSTMRSLKKIVKQKNEKNVHVIGMMLMPLYNQLVTFKMNEYAIANDNNAMAGKRVHPIYKEIRSTMKMIHETLGSIGEEGDSFQDGETGYYEELFENGETPYE